MTILVVDDLPGNRVLVKHILQASHFRNVILAESANRAFEILGLNSDDSEPPRIDLVLMDIMMPGIDGIEACRLIRESERCAGIPVMMVTALSEVDTLEDAFDAGAVDYVTKPINQVELQARVRSALTLKHEMDERRRKEVALRRSEKQLLEMTRLLSETNKRLSHLSRSDDLTGIPNRRWIMEQLDQEWRRSARDRRWLSVLMIDVDYFKKYNDHFGHQGGDECLAQVANALRRSLHRPADIVSRYGGEEFLAVLPDTPPEGAHRVAQVMRASVEDLRLAHPNSSVCPHVTVSLGTASGLPSDRFEATGLITLADKALYQAKGGGRNRIAIGETLAGPPVEAGRDFRDSRAGGTESTSDKVVPLTVSANRNVS